MALGDLVVKLSADIASFQSDLNRAQGQAQQFAGKIKSLFATIGVTVGAGAFVSLIKGSIDALDKLDE